MIGSDLLVRLRRFTTLLVLLPLAAACSEDPTGPEIQPVRQLMVAAEDSAFIDLAADTAVLVTGASSAAWDFGFWQTAAFVNASAGASVLCLCQNAAATPAEIMEMSPESELADFEAVTAADIPASGWSATVFNENRWYRYNLTGTDHQIWPTFDVYLVRRGSEVYKVQLIGYYNAEGDPRYVTFRYVKLEG